MLQGRPDGEHDWRHHPPGEKSNIFNILISLFPHQVYVNVKLTSKVQNNLRKF